VQQLPEKFKDKVRSLLNKEAELFFDAIYNEPVTSVRVNPYKNNKIFAEEVSVPWYQQAKFLKKRPSFIADPLFHAGAYYVQEASSMFVAHVIKQLIGLHTSDVRILDLCAAPGGKSTLILDQINDSSLLVSNEIIKTRVNILEENIIKWGRSNVVLTNNDPKDFTLLTNYFDVILVDAPCSGEGMFRKDKNAISEWSEDNVQLCANRQQRILADILPALKPGGFIIYSTCTFNTTENEENVLWMEQEFGLKSKEINVDNNWGIATAINKPENNLNAYRFYPHKVQSEGFFVACLQKPSDDDCISIKIKEHKFEKLKPNELTYLSDWLDDLDQFQIINASNHLFAFPKLLANEMMFLRSILNVRLSGLKLGELMKGKLVPDHQLALSIHINKNIPAIEVDKTDALKFLRKDAFDVSSVPQNIYAVNYNQVPLGWVKIMPNRMNNYLPVNWRILKDLKDLLQE
jgi:NOL1/NOP2/sun family putative RNA methylase